MIDFGGDVSWLKDDISGVGGRMSSSPIVAVLSVAGLSPHCSTVIVVLCPASCTGLVNSIHVSYVWAGMWVVFEAVGSLGGAALWVWCCWEEAEAEVVVCPGSNPWGLSSFSTLSQGPEALKGVPEILSSWKVSKWNSFSSCPILPQL